MPSQWFGIKYNEVLTYFGKKEKNIKKKFFDNFEGYFLLERIFYLESASQQNFHHTIEH